MVTMMMTVVVMAVVAPSLCEQIGGRHDQGDCGDQGHEDYFFHSWSSRMEKGENPDRSWLGQHTHDGGSLARPQGKVNFCPLTDNSLLFQPPNVPSRWALTLTPF